LSPVPYVLSIDQSGSLTTRRSEPRGAGKMLAIGVLRLGALSVYDRCGAAQLESARPLNLQIRVYSIRKDT
jgi:hypothetical protein